MKTRPLFKNITSVIALGAALMLLAPNTSQAQEYEPYEERNGSVIFSFAGVASGAVEDLEKRGDEGPTRDDINWGIGALVEFNVNELFGLETGVLYLRKVYEARSDALNSALVQEVYRLHIPVAARFWLSDYFSLAAGPFISIKAGEVKNTVELGGFDASYSTSADDDFEWGLDFAATVNFAIAEKTGFFIEGRYSLDLDQESNEKSDQLSGLLGIKLDLGS